MRARLATVALAALAVLGQGCSTPLPQTITVRAPVAVPCVVQAVPRPVLPVDNLEVGADTFIVSRALWSSMDLLEGWAVRAEAAIESCR